jgi:hypothetical protein
MTTTTRNYKSYPAAAAGVTAASGTSAWTFGSWVELVPVNTITSIFYIAALIGLEEPTAPVDVRHEVVAEIGTGAGGSEVVIISIPVDTFIDSAVGHLASWYLMLPEPKEVAANTRIAVRVADEEAAARTYGPFKIFYQQ